MWDALDIPLLRRNRLECPEHAERSDTAAIRPLMQSTECFYFDYFCSLMKGQKTISADITPSYSGLGATRLLKIQQGFEERGVNVKAIILIREPLSRIKSAVRFNLDRKNYGEGIMPFETNFEAALDQYYQSEHCTLRTRYQHIIEEARKVFDDDQLHIGVYETMFTEPEMKRLSGFLGIETRSEFGAVRVNKTQGAVYETFIDEAIKEYYTDVYEYCRLNYPITKDLWA